MRKGILEYCILLAINNHEAYTFDILQQLRDGGLEVVEGTIYPLLTRMKNNGYLSYRWEESTQGPPRKYFSLTPEGREMLSELEQSYSELETLIHHLKSV